jgi:hypothetical protein
MSQDQDLPRNPDYYAARAAEERGLAKAAKDPAVRSVHLEMADRYDARSRAGEAPEGRFGSASMPMEQEQA